MIKPMLPAACGLLCLLALSACATEAASPAPSPASSAVQAPSPVRTPGAALSPEVSPILAPAPLTEEDLADLYAADGYEVVNVTPYRGDYVVEYRYDPNCGSYGGGHMVDWVFHETGGRVLLANVDERAGVCTYEVVGPGTVRFRTEFYRIDALYKTIPRSWEVSVLVDESGALPNDYIPVEVEWRDLSPVWLDPREPFYTGIWDTEHGGPYELERMGAGRYEQLYDARIDADGLSFTFIPNADSMERYISFSPVATSAPDWETDFDRSSGIFTFRMRRVSLSCGSLPEEELRNFGTDQFIALYPYSFPAGSLGRDSHFLTDVQLAQDGEDTVVTARLTDNAGSFTVETGNLGQDNIPKLRVVFQEPEPGA